VPTDPLDATLIRLGFTEFRPGQREAIDTLLERRRLLLVAPTGGGKSLAYQLPALILGGTTLVISPLIALMNDQVESLERRGVSATFLASTLDSAELGRRIEAMEQGRYELIYVAPERLALDGFRARLRRLDCPLVAIDEAHCISEWGHDFRPEYLQIGALIRDLPEARILACTATATPIVRDEILARLGLGADTPQLIRGFARPNLILRAAETAGAAERRRRVDAQLADALRAPGEGRGSAIVYSPTRKMAEAEARRLSELGWRSDPYHAGLAPAERARTQGEFGSGRLEVVVATNAFGMGIDRGDVRTVIHLAPPGSLESYYQEVGRAGRDGEPAWGLMLSSAQDFPLRRRMIEAEIEGRAPDASVVEHKWSLFLELMRWAEGGSCRHDAILRYFGTQEDALQGCGRCDVCVSLATPEAGPELAAELARKALCGVARVHRRYGLGLAAKLLRGDPDPRLSRSSLDRVSTFGVLADRRPEWIIALLRRCVTAGWVSFTTGERPLAVLTREGGEVMYGRKPARILLPPERSRTQPAPVTRRAAAAALKPVAVELESEDLELFEKLRAHRLETARELAVPPFVVASDRTLRGLAQARPAGQQELLEIHGIGPTKARQFGADWLEVIGAHVAGEAPPPRSGASEGSGVGSSRGGAGEQGELADAVRAAAPHPVIG